MMVAWQAYIIVGYIQRFAAVFLSLRTLESEGCYSSPDIIVHQYMVEEH